MTDRRPPARSEAGFTLVEMMVVLVLMSLVSFTLLGFLNSTTEVTTRAGANVESEREAQIVLRTLGQDIRSAISIATVYPGSPVCPTGVSFASPYAGYRNCISIRIARPVTVDESCPYTDVVYGLAGGVLRTTRKEYVVSGGTCTLASTTPAKLVMNDLVNPAGTPLFTYYDRTAAVLSSAPTAAASVKITLVKRYRRLNAPDLTLSSVVALRNAR